jgi:predicted dehydrogenase
MSLRCAVAGLNRGRIYADLIAAHPECDLVAVCDERPAQLESWQHLATFTSFDEMLAQTQPDMVAIITPGPQHAPQSIAALQAGAHVFVETPNVYSVEEADRIVKLARAGNLKYTLAEDYVYMEWCRRLIELVREGELGEIIGAAAEYTHDCRGFILADDDGHLVPFDRLGEPGIHPLWRMTDLPPLAYSSHTLGPLLEIMDDRCISAAGAGGGRTQMAGVDVMPLESAVFQTEKGAMVRLTNGFVIASPITFTYTLYGTRGSVRVMDYGQPRAIIATDATGTTWRDLDLGFDHGWAGGQSHLHMIANDYLNAVLTDTKPPFDEARSMDFCLPGVIAHQSAQFGGDKLPIPLY